MKLAWQLLLDFVFGEHWHSSADYYNVLPFQIRDAKYESPVEVALAGQGIIVNVGLLVILVSNPATQLFQADSEPDNTSKRLIIFTIKSVILLKRQLIITQSRLKIISFSDLTD